MEKKTTHTTWMANAVYNNNNNFIYLFIINGLGVDKSARARDNTPGSGWRRTTPYSSQIRAKRFEWMEKLPTLFVFGMHMSEIYIIIDCLLCSHIFVDA